MMSLYDYLGKPAGGELGKEVAKQAAKEKIKFSQREVKTKFYEGKVMVYPESFLRRYFDEEIELGDEVINDDLPF
tara:strand:+ start:134 stop:358 length:225 start_codon:yes stop_codon:yes gene_type:complete